jgi:hypothetical protein
MAASTGERVKESLKREESYLLDIKKAIEQQIAVLKAEMVVLDRQIAHHEGTPAVTSYVPPATIPSQPSPNPNATPLQLDLIGIR